MTSITVEERFEAAHCLPYVPEGHKCGRMHGHSYRVAIELTGDVGVKGWVRDFGDVKTAWRDLHGQLDHNTLNDVEGLENPTAENLAEWIFMRLTDQLPELSSVTVWETIKCSATFRLPV
jgi:6-pyruvoyltetrahydropterin/6-carboxytetrahydropterin synthase